MSIGTATADPQAPTTTPAPAANAPDTVKSWYDQDRMAHAAVDRDQQVLATDQAAATVSDQGLLDAVSRYNGMPVVQIDMSDPANPTARVFTLAPGGGKVQIVDAAIADRPLPVPATPAAPAAPAGDGTAPASAAS